MSCAHGCRDGLLSFYDADGTERVAYCPCQGKRSRSEFKGDYRPGGLTTRSKWRAAGRRGGIASGVKRRQLARGRSTPIPRGRTRHEGLTLAIELEKIPHLSKRQFERRYRTYCEDVWKIRFNQAGLDTCWTLYNTTRRLIDAAGQGALTTNDQRAAAMEIHCSRYRSRRTVQQARKRLEDMGLAIYRWVHRSGAKRIHGQMDLIRVRILDWRINCTPPPGAPTDEVGLVGATNKNVKNDPVEPPTAAETDRPEAETTTAPVRAAGNRGIAAPPCQERPRDPTVFTADRIADARARAEAAAAASAEQLQLWSGERERELTELARARRAAREGAERASP